MEPTNPLVLRAMERIIAIGVAGICIYLGYRLFIKLPEQADSSGKVILPGNISIYLSRVGPGAFFALFGAIVIGYSVHNLLTINQTTSETAPGVREQAISTSYFTGSQKGSFQGDLEIVKGDIKVITELEKKLQTEGRRNRDMTQLALTFRRMKMYAVKSIWSETLGDYPAFETWVLKGCSEPAPAEIAEAAAIYLAR